MKFIYYFLLLVSVAALIFIGYETYSSKEISPTENVSAVMENASRKSYKIVAFGDSLTAGYGVPLEDSYPFILEDVLNKRFSKADFSIQVINMGVSGESTSGGLDRVAFVVSQKPDLVLLGLGANDMLRATDPSITRNNLDIIVQEFREANVPLVLLGMESQVSNGLFYKQNFDSIYPDLSKKYKVALVPFFLRGVALVPSLNNADGIHPNRVGYEKIIDDNILPVLLPILESNLK